MKVQASLPPSQQAYEGARIPEDIRLSWVANRGWNQAIGSSRLAIGFATMFDGQHNHRMTEVVEANAIIAYPKTQLRRIDIV